MTFCGTFHKNVARIECVIHHERLYNDCVWLKKIQFAKNFSKMPNVPLGHFRSSLPEVLYKTGILENFAKFTGNPLYWSLFLIKLQSSSPQFYLKKETSIEFSRKPPGDCLVFQYFKIGFSLCISFCRIF